MSLNLILTDKEFYGRYIEQMSLLRAEGRTPLTTAQLMERKLNSPREVRLSYVDNYFYTGDAVVYNPNGRFKVDLDSQDLRGINPSSRLRNGALALDRSYDSINTPEFTREELILGRSLTAEEAKAHLVWRALAQDQHLLDEYVAFIFKEAKQRFNYDQNMGLYIVGPESVPTVRAWCVDGLGYGSYAGGGIRLDSVCYRLVGVAPKAHVSKTLDDKVEVLQDGQVLKYQGRTYVVVPQELLKQ